MDISPAQSRAARGLLDWSQAELGRRSNLSESTIRDFEKGRRTPGVNNVAAIRAALESAGVIFVEENGEGPGVRLRKGTTMQNFKNAQLRAAIDRVKARAGKATADKIDAIETAPRDGSGDVSDTLADTYGNLQARARKLISD